MNDNELRTELRERREHGRAQTQHADTKAAVLAGAVVPAVAAAIAAGALIGLPAAAAVVGWAAAALGLAVVFELGAALWPRSGGAERPDNDGVALVDGLAATTTDTHHVNLAREVLALEHIVAAKHRWLRLAFATAATAVLLAAVTVALTLTR
ncbi:hypothetical protein [Glycomyces paridis]|uniref:Pycsar effector protein domain-containing protein n=1 Tax=Glycomyces paridis TaxID=2126555 RepID=A0A4S8PGK6_9ACTN|nr:hypothetical protein [Glycomyces paridis]THV29640.1 hypothetical protein E9998_09155 [Glycomyces paridis]